jgi:hypothetical protein
MSKLESQIRYTSNVVRYAMLFALFALCLAAPSTAQADVVTDWNAIAVARTAAAGQGPPQQGRTMSIMHAAIFDAVNAIEPRYTVYAVSPPVTLPASNEAAAVAAGYGVLVRLFPAAKPTLDSQYAASLALIPDGDAKTNGIAVGEFVAAAMVALRSADGSAPIAYTLPPPGLGIWRPIPATPSASPAPPSNPQWGGVTPFVLESATQFHVPPPPELTSTEYAADVNEVKLYGGSTSTLRTEDQTKVVRFWTESGVLGWNRIASAIALQQQTSIQENARIFALLNMAFSDASVVVFETKYRFTFWRPRHAIRENDGTIQYDDGNPDTVPDPTWTSLIAAPNHPEYLSGHCISSSAAAEVLTQIFGQNVGFTTTSTTLPGEERSYSSFWEAAREVVDARVFGGIHFRRTCMLSNEVGRKIGKFAVKNYLLRLSDN